MQAYLRAIATAIQMLCECQMAHSATAGQWSCALKSCTCTEVCETEAVLSLNVPLG